MSHAHGLQSQVRYGQHRRQSIACVVGSFHWSSANSRTTKIFSVDPVTTLRLRFANWSENVAGVCNDLSVPMTVDNGLDSVDALARIVDRRVLAHGDNGITVENYVGAVLSRIGRTRLLWLEFWSDGDDAHIIPIGVIPVERTVRVVLGSRPHGNFWSRLFRSCHPSFPFLSGGFTIRSAISI